MSRVIQTGFALLFSAILTMVPALASLPLTGAGMAGRFASGMITPIIAGGSGITNPSNANINFTQVEAGYESSYNLTKGQQVMPTDGTLSNIGVSFPTGLSQGSYNVGIDYASQDISSTQFYTTIKNSSSPATATYLGTLAVAAGNLAAWEVTPSGTPTVQTTPAQFSALFQSTYGNESPIVFGASTTNVSNANGTLNYIGPGGMPTPSTTDVNVSGLFPVSGQIAGLFCSMNGSPGNGASYACTANHNGSAVPGMSCTISGTATSCCITTTAITSDTNCSTASSAISISPGDTISVSSNPSGSPAALQLTAGLVWVPPIPGQAILFTNWHAGVPPASAARYCNINGLCAAQTTDAAVHQLIPPLGGHKWTFSNLMAAQNSSTQSRTFNLRDNGNDEMTATGCALGSMTIGGVSAYGCLNSTDTYSPSAGDEVDIKTVALTGAAPTWIKSSIVVTVQ